MTDVLCPITGRPGCLLTRPIDAVGEKGRICALRGTSRAVLNARGSLEVVSI